MKLLGFKMKIDDDQLNNSALSCFGIEAVGLLLSGNYVELAQRFGYSMSYARVPAEAIKEDFANCCPSNSSRWFNPSIVVKYFKPNVSELLAVVECNIQLGTGAQVLIELVATRASDGIYLTLEDIYVQA
jgi:hypothetical protein